MYKRQVHPTAKVAEGAELIEPLFVGPNAVIEAGARVGPFAQIGAGATVRAGAKVSEAIVWPGAQCEGEWSSTVCTGA